MFSKYDVDFMNALRIAAPEPSEIARPAAKPERHDCYASVVAQVGTRHFTCAVCGVRLHSFNVGCRLGDCLVKAQAARAVAEERVEEFGKSLKAWENVVWGLIAAIAMVACAWGWPRG